MRQIDFFVHIASSWSGSHGSYLAQWDPWPCRGRSLPWGSSERPRWPCPSDGDADGLWQAHWRCEEERVQKRMDTGYRWRSLSRLIYIYLDKLVYLYNNNAIYQRFTLCRSYEQCEIKWAESKPIWVRQYDHSAIICDALNCCVLSKSQ